MGHCEVIGCECYYDGSTLNAEKPWELLLTEGHEAVWQFLLKEYDAVFNEIHD
jgi:hypothetical protein